MFAFMRILKLCRSFICMVMVMIFAKISVSVINCPAAIDRECLCKVMRFRNVLDRLQIPRAGTKAEALIRALRQSE